MFLKRDLASVQQINLFMGVPCLFLGGHAICCAFSKNIRLLERKARNTPTQECNGQTQGLHPEKRRQKGLKIDERRFQKTRNTLKMVTSILICNLIKRRSSSLKKKNKTKNVHRVWCLSSQAIIQHARFNHSLKAQMCVQNVHQHRCFHRMRVSTTC